MPSGRSKESALESIWQKVHSPEGLPFPQTVGALLELGATRYSIDFVGCTVTAYINNTSSSSTTYVTPIPDFFSHQGSTAPSPTMFNWDEVKLRDTIRRVQAGEGNYREFANRMVQAGVVGYHAFLTGQRVMYYGDKGETWVEVFPGAKQ